VNNGRENMKPRLCVPFLLAFSGCVAGGVDFTQPSAVLGLTGNYVLSVQTARECELPVSRYEWDVVGTRGADNSTAVTLTLPGGDRRVHIVFCGSCQADPSQVLGDLDTGGPPAGDAPLPGGLKLLAQLTLTGTVQAGAGGRGEVIDQPADGALSISRIADVDSDALGVCLSNVHSWSLRPR
jgi:hypothetical protein